MNKYQLRSMDPAACPALLALEDGTLFWGHSLGAPGEAFGEIVFNTGMTGYQEVLTDPSYRGQIVAMTYPEIGIYGTNSDDVESAEVQVAGFAVHHAVQRSSNQRATASLPDYLAATGVVAVEGVDTRTLTRHIRARGAMRAAISSLDLEPESLVARVRQSPEMMGRNLVRESSPGQTAAAPAGARFRVVLIDTGSKAGIVRDLAALGATVLPVPFDAGIEAVLVLRPDGALVTNGPGDPAVLEPAIRLVRGLLERRVPLAGICLGHQLLSLALGGHTYKMLFGHRGANHPVKDLAAGRILITTQNHGFAVDPASLGVAAPALGGSAPGPLEPGSSDSAHDTARLTMAERLPAGPLEGSSPLGFGPLEITHLSLNDGTVEGLRLRDLPALSVQFHPEASPGPHDARAFFAGFAALMEAHHA